MRWSSHNAVTFSNFPPLLYQLIKIQVETFYISHLFTELKIPFGWKTSVVCTQFMFYSWKYLDLKLLLHDLTYSFFLFQFAGETFHIEYLTDLVKEWQEKERGSFPTPIECTIIVWVFSCIWRDLKEVYERHSDLESIIPFGNSAIPSIKIWLLSIASWLTSFF